MRLLPSSPTSLLPFLLLPILTSASPVTTTTTTPSADQTPTPTLLPSPQSNPSSTATTPTQTPNPNLDLREIVVGDPALAVQPLNPTQVSPVTTLMLWATVAPGAPAQQIQVVYSQAFDEVPDQWEVPVVGSVGLGTITGQVGVVRTLDKRAAAATAAPAAGKREAEPFIILPPGNDGKRGVLEKRQRRGGSGSGGSGEEEEGAAARMVVIGAAPSALALLVAVLGVLVM